MIVQETFKKEDINAIAENNRQWHYAKYADPLYMEVQRGDATMEDWKAKIQEIKDQFPYVTEDQIMDIEYPDTETEESAE